jgi:formylglycine-generating enzyme required for sulfatase activity
VAVSIDNGQFVLIQSGRFEMGYESPQGGVADQRPVHTVNITRAFYLQSTEVTQRQWRDVMGTNPSASILCGDDCPVESVSPDDIVVFLQRLNADNPGANYRLPTEAEWEYAARAGRTGILGGNSLTEGWWRDNSGNQPHPVGQKDPNPWGLHDMYGNVMEIVQDWYHPGYYSISPTDDPPGPSTGFSKAVRSTWWNEAPVHIWASRRGSILLQNRANNTGLRLARTR